MGKRAVCRLIHLYVWENKGYLLFLVSRHCFPTEDEDEEEGGRRQCQGGVCLKWTESRWPLDRCLKKKNREIILGVTHTDIVWTSITKKYSPQWQTVKLSVKIFQVYSYPKSGYYLISPLLLNPGFSIDTHNECSVQSVDRNWLAAWLAGWMDKWTAGWLRKSWWWALVPL